MAGIRAKHTAPELAVRKALHRRGFRYSLYARAVPGKPDLVLRSRNVVIFVHGCFWHAHDCRFFRLPETRREFWQKKLARNQERDKDVSIQLEKAGWRQLIIWECATRGQHREAIDQVADRAAAWIKSAESRGEIRGL